MNLSVIIPAYNKVEDALRCVTSLGAYMVTGPELAVQDDASPDADFRGLMPGVERNARNLGFAGNCNAGAARTRGELLFFVNQDVYASAGWSERWDESLVNAFSDESVGVVGARLLFPDGSIQSAGGLIDARRQPYHRCLGYKNPLYHEVNTSREVTWVTGAALAIRRKLFEQLAGFDEQYAGGYFEDVDLCLRAREAGFKVWYEPGCTLMHKVGSTGGSASFRDNAYRFYRRWVSGARIMPDTTAVYARYW